MLKTKLPERFVERVSNLCRLVLAPQSFSVLTYEKVKSAGTRKPDFVRMLEDVLVVNSSMHTVNICQLRCHSHIFFGTLISFKGLNFAPEPLVAVQCMVNTVWLVASFLWGSVHNLRYSYPVCLFCRHFLKNTFSQSWCC